MIMRRSCRLALSVGTILSVGCRTFQPTTLEEINRARQVPDPLRLTTVDGRKLKLVRTAVRGDSVLGETPNRSAAVRMHTNQIRRIEARKFSADATGLAVIGTVLVGGPLLLLALIASSGGISW